MKVRKGGGAMGWSIVKYSRGSFVKFSNVSKEVLSESSRNGKIGGGKGPLLHFSHIRVSDMID